MSHSLPVESLRLIVAGYLLVIAAAAAGGWHRPLLSYPLHAIYAALRLCVMILTLGQIRMSPLTRRAKATTRRHRQRREARREVVGSDAVVLESESVTWQSGAPYPVPPSAPTVEDEDPPPPPLW